MSKDNQETVEGVVNIDGGPIRKTNRFFLALRSYGHCNEKGKVVMGIECSTEKVMAPPDKPLELFTAILEELLPCMLYSSNEAAEEDLEAFKQFVSNLTMGATDEQIEGPSTDV